MTKAEMLADAKAQYHLLLTGQKASVVVDQNGERVEYTQANAAKLQAYIASLQACVDGNGAVSRRPMKIWIA